MDVVGVLFVVVYRPPYSNNHRATVSVFFREFSEYLESILLTTAPLVITGDFNIHVDNIDDQDAVRFCELLESVNLELHVNQPTHVHGHTLDLIITRKSEVIIKSTPVPVYLFSDHFSLLCDLDLNKPQLSVKNIALRKINEVDIQMFIHDICVSDLFNTISQETPDNVDDLTTSYNNVLRDILDQHEPIKTKNITVRPRVPWYIDEVKNAKTSRRKAENEWRKSKLLQDLNCFKRNKNNVTFLMNKARREYYPNFVNENSDDQRKLFKVSRSLLNLYKTLLLPPHSNDTELANKMGTFFVQKISKIRSRLDETGSSHLLNPDPIDSRVCDTSLIEFDTLSEESVRKLILRSNKKCCILDHIPTKLLIDCLDILLPVITRMAIHLFVLVISLMSGNQLLYLPLLKKPGLDLKISNFRPISNLHFVSKLAEQVVANQLQCHLSNNNLLPIAQSAYR